MVFQPPGKDSLPAEENHVNNYRKMTDLTGNEDQRSSQFPVDHVVFSIIFHGKRCEEKMEMKFHHFLLLRILFLMDYSQERDKEHQKWIGTFPLMRCR